MRSSLFKDLKELSLDIEPASEIFPTLSVFLILPELLLILLELLFKHYALKTCLMPTLLYSP